MNDQQNQPIDCEPGMECMLCPRLADYRHELREKEPDWHNGPVPNFGPDGARLLIVGLAPGVRGANRTGRPFTGDYAGDLLYETLAKFGFSNDRFGADISDGLELIDASVTNAVRCVPPQNKPVGAEITACREFLIRTIAAHSNVRAIVALGGIAHQSVLSARGLRKVLHKFSHQAHHDIGGGITLFDSYHCSRYNTNTKRLTPDMFRAVFADVRAYLDALPA